MVTDISVPCKIAGLTENHLAMAVIPRPDIPLTIFSRIVRLWP